MTPRVALPFSQRVPLRHPKGRVCASPLPNRTAGAARTQLGVTKVSDTTVLFFYYYLDKYWKVDSINFDEILDEGRPFGIQELN